MIALTFQAVPLLWMKSRISRVCFDLAVLASGFNSPISNQLSHLPQCKTKRLSAMHISKNTVHRRTFCTHFDGITREAIFCWLHIEAVCMKMRERSYFQLCGITPRTELDCKAKALSTLINVNKRCAECRKEFNIAPKSTYVQHI